MITRILTSPLPIRGDVPGLLCRGMPVLSLDGGEQGVVTDASEPWLPWVAYCDTDGRRRHDGYTARSWNIDWSSPLAIYAAIHWLSGRGHDCWWMRPADVGGRTADWNEAAILVSVSVGRVVRGLSPVSDILAPWLLAADRDPDTGATWVRHRLVDPRNKRGGLWVCEHIQPWREFGWECSMVPAPVECPWMWLRGPETGDAGKVAADAAALADGAALRVEGGVMVGVVE